MYRRIIVPLDGTRFGEHALPHAVDIAARTGAAIELVHVHHHRERDPELAAMPQYQYQRIADADLLHDQEALTAEQAYLEGKAADIEARYAVRVATRVLTGRTAEAVAAEAQSIVADLVVLASHARQGVARVRHGDLAHELIGTLNVPALCIHPLGEETPITAPEIRRVLVPLDGSEFSEQILEPLAPLLMEMIAQPTLLHVLSPRPLLGSGMSEEGRGITTRPQALAYLKEVADRYRGRIPEPVLTALEDSQPARVVASLMSVGEYDMVAMATHGRSGLSRVLLGSVAGEVLRQVDKPVLLYQPRRNPEPAGDLAEAFQLYGD
jgi:nucleotide-binding universal stress UspA family protein